MWYVVYAKGLGENSTEVVLYDALKDPLRGMSAYNTLLFDLREEGWRETKGISLSPGVLGQGVKLISQTGLLRGGRSCVVFLTEEEE